MGVIATVMLAAILTFGGAGGPNENCDAGFGYSSGAARWTARARFCAGCLGREQPAAQPAKPPEAALALAAGAIPESYVPEIRRVPLLHRPAAAGGGPFAGSANR